jgi:hypothetical protein
MEAANEALPRQFAVEGHKAYYEVFIFYHKPGNFVPSGGFWKATLEAKIDDGDWQELHKFEFYIDPKDLFEDSKYHIGPAPSRIWE